MKQGYKEDICDLVNARQECAMGHGHVIGLFRGKDLALLRY